MTDYKNLLDPRVAVIEVTPSWAGDVDIKRLDDALLAAGIPSTMLPSAPSRVDAMKRAFDACAPRGAVVDKLLKGKGVSLTIKDTSKLDLEELDRIALVTGQPKVKSSNEAFSTTLTCKIEVINTNGAEVETRNFTPPDHPMIPLLEQVYQVKRGVYHMSEDISQWFSQGILHSLGAVAKRSRGGVYYVPASNRDTLLKVATALDNVSSAAAIVGAHRVVNGVACPVQNLVNGGKLYMEPKTNEDSAAVEIMIDRIIGEADSTLDDVAKALEGTPGERALKSKRELLQRISANVKVWETLTGSALKLLHDRVAELDCVAGVMELTLEASKEAKK